MKRDLIWRWIAEGFVHKEGKYSAYELGKRCFNELVNRSLIQPVKLRGPLRLDKYDKVLACRVHDTILDFIVSKSIEENFVTFIGAPSLTIGTQSRVHRLSNQVVGKGNSFVPTSLRLSHARSLNAFGNTAEIPSIGEFKHLRVVDFRGCTQLENHHLVNVGRLSHLRYLNISTMKVSELPEQIGHLHCLEMLDIMDTNVSDLPASFVNLRKLAHFRADQCVRFPDGIAKMQALETLKIVQASMQSYNFLQELGELKNLRKLYLFHMHDVEHKEVVASSLRKLCLQNLSSLTMWNDFDNIVLNTWCMAPPLNLQKLVTINSGLPKVPDWVGLLVNVQILRLEVMSIRHEDLCILGSLPALLTLFLRGLQGPYSCKDRKLAVPSEAGFRCLKMFHYDPWYDWMDLMFEVRCMPKLEKLEINMCLHFSAQLESLATPGAFDFGIENLGSLLTFHIELHSPLRGLRSTTVDAVKASVERAVSTHPNC